MGVDGNFQRLEDEVSRLLDVLEELRQENAALRGRVDSLTAQEAELLKLKERLGQMEGEAREEAAKRQEMRARIQRILSRLDEIPH
jgi:small-conductance mechanosensitive channel